VRRIASVDELRADLFESDEEMDEFLADLEAFRHEHTACHQCSNDTRGLKA
jgi:hypothetical protein